MPTMYKNQVLRMAKLNAPDGAMILAQVEPGTVVMFVHEHGGYPFHAAGPGQLADDAEFLVVPIGHGLDWDDDTDPRTYWTVPPEPEE